jgi:hypothetical protein
MRDVLNKAVANAYNSIAQQGHLCVLTDTGSLCDTLDKITSYHTNTGNLLVWSGASDNTIFGDAQVNYMFRAWHDFIHIKHQLPFTQQGEHEVMLIQQQNVMAMEDLSDDEKRFVCLILEAEVDGQIEELKQTGKFVEDQVQFTLNYLNRKGIQLCLN